MRFRKWSRSATASCASKGSSGKRSVPPERNVPSAADEHQAGAGGARPARRAIHRGREEAKRAGSSEAPRPLPSSRGGLLQRAQVLHQVAHLATAEDAAHGGHGGGAVG